MREMEMNPWVLVSWLMAGAVALLIVFFTVLVIAAMVDSLVDQSKRKRIERERMLADVQRFSGRDI